MPLRLFAAACLAIWDVLRDQSLEASSLVAPSGGNSNSEAMKMVDELFEDLKLLTDIFKSPILHHIAMK